MKDSGGNTMFTSNGSGTLSSINSSFSGGGPALLSTATASDSANLSFSNTYLTSTYKYYLIKFIEILNLRKLLKICLKEKRKENNS